MSNMRTTATVEEETMEKNIIAETPRLRIREFVPEDVEALYALYQAGDVGYVEPLSNDRDEERKKIENYILYAYRFYGMGFWAVEEKATGALIGRCGIQVGEIDGTGAYELGYLIRKDRRGKGYGKEAVRAVMTYGKSVLEIENLHVRIHEENETSVKFIENLGFSRKKAYVSGENKIIIYFKKL